MRALTTSVGRKPNQRIARAAVNFMSNAPIAVAKVKEPDSNGDRPKPICKRSGRRNGKAPMPIRKMSPPTTPEKKVGILRSFRSRIASGLPLA